MSLTAIPVSAASSEDDGVEDSIALQLGSSVCRIVLITGFESFNVQLYKKVAPGAFSECWCWK